MVFKKIIAGHYEYVPLDGDPDILVQRFVPDSAVRRALAPEKDLAAIKAGLKDIDSFLSAKKAPSKFVSDMMVSQNNDATDLLPKTSGKRALPPELRALYEKGIETYQAKKEEDVQEVVDKINTLGFAYVEAFILKKIAMAKELNDLDLAIDHTEVLIEVMYKEYSGLFHAPSDVINPRRLVAYLKDNGKFRVADKLYETLRSYSVLLARAARFKETLFILHILIELNPDDYRNYMNLATCHYQLQQFDGFEQSAFRLLEVVHQQNNIDIIARSKDLLCRYYCDIGEYEKVRELEERSLADNDVPSLFQFFDAPIDVSPEKRYINIAEIYKKSIDQARECVFYHEDNGFIPKAHYSRISRTLIIDDYSAGTAGLYGRLYPDDEHEGKMIMEVYTKGSINQIYHSACHEIGHSVDDMLPPSIKKKWVGLSEKFNLGARYTNRGDCVPHEEAFADAYASFALLREYWGVLVDTAKRQGKNTELFDFFEEVFALEFHNVEADMFGSTTRNDTSFRSRTTDDYMEQSRVINGF